MKALLFAPLLLVPALSWAAETPQGETRPQAGSPTPPGQRLVLGQPQGGTQGGVAPNAAQAPSQKPDARTAATPSSGATGNAGEKQTPPEEDAQALFQQSLRQMMPLSEDQIQEYRKWSDQRDRALLPVAPSLGSRSVRVELEPGRAPVVVRTTANIASSLVFHDATGQPWPITSVTNGGPQFFQILRPELPAGNLLNVMPIQAYGSANIVVTFEKKDVPLVIRLEADSVRSPERRADGMVLFQIGQHGPQAQVPLTKEFRESASSVMLAFLDHTPPSEAVRIPLDPQEGMTLWEYRKTYYLRTRDSLMWPAWSAVVNGAGGIRCYEVQKTPRLLVSRDGVIETYRVKDTRHE